MSAAADRLSVVFRDALALPADTDVHSLTYRGIPEWDSVAHMQLVMEIEAAFDIMLPTEDVIGMSSFAAALAIVERLSTADA